MGRRAAQRITTNLSAELLFGDNLFKGLIVNVSESGLGYVLTSYVEVTDEFMPERRVRVSFQTPAKDKMSLECEIVWFSRPSPDAERLAVGLAVIDPSLNYFEFVGKLEGDSSPSTVTCDRCGNVITL